VCGRRLRGAGVAAWLGKTPWFGVKVKVAVDEQDVDEKGGVA